MSIKRFFKKGQNQDEAIASSCLMLVAALAGGPPVLSYSFEWAARLIEFGNFWHKSVDQSSLEDQDKQQIDFYVIRFTKKYSNRLVATASLKVLDFQCLKILGSVRLSLRLCKILVQFVTFMFFSGHIRICVTLPTAAVFAL